MTTATVDRTERAVTAKIVTAPPDIESAPATPEWAKGLELVYPNDAWLDAPEIYYSPDDMNAQFRTYIPNLPRGAYYQHQRFHAGRFLARTQVQRASVRRKLGQNADRYQGDNMSDEWVCSNAACRFATRNRHAWKDHCSTTEHDRPWQPQPI
jgi:hypothetical protein